MAAWRQWLLGGLTLISVGLTWLVSRQPDGYVHVWVFPEGEGMVLRTPQGQGVLVDTTTDPRRAQAFLGRVLPPWVRELALVISTSDKTSALDVQARVLEFYPAKVGWLSAGLPPSEPWQRQVIEWHKLSEGLSWEGDGVRWRVLNGAPPVILMETGRFRVLYAPWGLPPNVVLPHAVVWVTDSLPISADASFPMFVVTRHPLPPDRPEAARQVLLHVSSRFFLASSEMVHFTTDGQRYRWEAAPLP